MSKAISRRPGVLPAIVLEAPPPETPGSVAWVAEAVFGGQRQFEDMLQSIVVGQGAQGDHRWRELMSVILRLRDSGTDYNLNQLCSTLGLSASELLSFVGQGVQEVQKGIAVMKASLKAPEVIDWAVAAAQDPENGTKDRQMLLTIAGVLQDKGGVNVNVNQQVGVKIGKEELLAPLRQFNGVATEIDSVLRDAVDGEIVDGN